MIDLTFQFISRESSPTINTTSRYIDEIIEKQGRVTAIELSDNSLIEFSKMGSIRYTVQVPRLGSVSLDEELNAAKSAILEILNTSVSEQDVCLLVSSKDPIQPYLENKTRIEEFGRKVLSCEDPDYTELNNSTIKVSFRTGKLAKSIC